MTHPQTHRICLTLHYDGGAFHGWQLQARERTVQGELERVVSRLFNAPTRVLGSGRTDRGVHATGQVATVDAPVRWAPDALRRAANALLPPEIWVADAQGVDPRFHPRYDATSRAYVYRVGLVDQSRSPFHAPYCWPLVAEVEVAAMQRACAPLVGDHSFRAFAKAGQEERGDRCIVHEARWERWGEMGLEFHVRANRFLHHMVRYLVGTLVDVGLGRRAEDELPRLLDPDTPLATSPPAPPQGLYLCSVAYPPPPFGPAPLAGGSRGAALPHTL